MNEVYHHSWTEINIFLLSSLENEKSKKIYDFHQKNYQKYVVENNVDEFTEKTIIDYFSGMY